MPEPLATNHRFASGTSFTCAPRLPTFSTTAAAALEWDGAPHIFHPGRQRGMNRYGQHRRTRF